MKVISFKGGHDRNLSYLIYTERQAFVIDPFKDIEIYLDKARELGFKIVGVLNTHLHKDHVEGNPAFEKLCIEIVNLSDKKELKLGSVFIKIIKTPGHSLDCKCFFVDGNLFTGDVLFAKRVGMTSNDADTRVLYKSLQKLKALSGKTIVWPGHYYNSGFPFTLAQELEVNEYLKAKDFEEFRELIDHWREYMERKKAER